MKKILLALTILIFSLFSPSQVFAQGTTDPGPEDAGSWTQDSEVTFVGKAATRSNDFLNWTLQNYDWLCVMRLDNGTCDNSDSPLFNFWLSVARIPFAFLVLFILAGAFVMIITRGQNIKLKQFAPRLIFIILLMILSFSIVRFLYVLTDIFQGQFLVLDQTNNQVIQSNDLLFIDFGYDFIGYRKVGMEYEESAYISLILVKLTAITYYVMTGLLIVRKIILWFFLIISSIFPLLLFYRPLRNTAKIWVGEFFRWLLYAPLFAVFLRGLVEMWRKGIPLPFGATALGGGEIVYPTAISILLAGPGVVPELENSVNNSDTFALYVVALIMLWVAILLPFLLLKIFLDYLNTISLSQNPVVQRLNKRLNIFNPPPTPRGPSQGGPSPEPSMPHPTGKARALPFLHRSIGTTQKIEANRTATNLNRRNENITSRTNITNTENVRKTSEVLKTANIEIPKMRDIAKFETQMLRKDSSSTSEAARYHDTLREISNPSVVTSVQERQKITKIKDTLTREKASGNPIAKQILTASQVMSRPKVAVSVNQKIGSFLQHIANTQTVTSPIEKQKVEKIKSELLQRRAKGDITATKVLESSEKISQAKTEEQKNQIAEDVKQTLTQAEQNGNQFAGTILQEQTPQVPQLPVSNSTQQVALEDYEEVRKIWVENYKTLEPPTSLEGETPTREEWVKQDEQNIDQAVNLLTSHDQGEVDKGMELVANILPFLLIGGFSKSEVVAYLKAKKEAGKTVLENLSQKKEQDDTLLDRQVGKKEEQKQMEMKRELPIEGRNNNGQNTEHTMNPEGPAKNEKIDKES